MRALSCMLTCSHYWPHHAVAPRYVTDGAMRESARADGVRDPELVNDINVQRAARLRLYSPGERYGCGAVFQTCNRLSHGPS